MERMRQAKEIMRKYAVCLIVISVVFSNGCTKPNPEEIKKLSTEIDKVNSQINETKIELKKYGEESALHAMVSLRLSVLEQTQAMLEQKKASSWYFPKATYTINGQNYSPPENINELIPTLENELVKSRDEWKKTQGKAESAGGLLGVIVLLESEVKGLRVAQIEYQLSAYKNGYLSLYPNIAPSELDSPVSKATEEIEKNAQKSSPEKLEKMAESKSAFEGEIKIIEIDAKITEKNTTWWKFAWRLTIMNSKPLGVNVSATIEFQDKDGFIIDDDIEHGLYIPAKGQETFTGYKLVTGSVAPNVASTSVKAYAE